MIFFFQVLRNFGRYFLKNWPYGSKVTQHYVVERRLKIWKFSGFVYKHMENGFLCQNSILSSEMQYLLSLQWKSLLYLLIFNTETIPYKKQ